MTSDTQTKAADLPSPLTPADCDIRSFPFIPLEIERLRRSKAWLRAKREPEIAFYMLNLWMASWHNTPAASLEDDDESLADLAMCDWKRWGRIKIKAMYGWIKCSDGRLYHPTVAEKALNAWKQKQDYRARTEAARKAKSDKKPTAVATPLEASAAGSVTGVVTTPVTELRQDPTITITETVKESSELRSAAVAPLGARAELWQNGLDSLVATTGKSKAACRVLLGKWSKQVRDDCAMLSSIIADCAEVRPGNPIAWISAGIAARTKPPDKFAWLDTQSPATPHALNSDMEMICDESGNFYPR